MNQIYIESNGCAVQRHETQRMAKYFRVNGWTETDDFAHADLILMTTCGVVQWTEDAAITAIQRLVAKSNPSAPILVGGCLPKINPARIRQVSKNFRQRIERI